MENPVTDVHLRKRSTPYDFTVDMTRGSDTLKLYGGASANLASTSYWQAVRSAAFLGLCGKVQMNVTLAREPYGGFSTELVDGKVKSLHIPFGKCIEWTDGSWSGDHLYEKMVATIPGMPGPIPRAN